MDYQFDNVDKQILALLLEDAMMPFTEIAQKIHVSSGTVHVRMRKMREAGVVTGSRLLVDHEKLGFKLTAFLGIYLERSEMYDDAAEKLSQIPELVSMHYTTGVYSIFCKIICRDTTHLRDILHDKIQKIPGIQRTETFISLQQGIERGIPLG